MDLTKDQIAAALNISPAELDRILEAGKFRTGQQAAQTALEQALQKSETLLSVDRQAIGKLQTALNAREAVHRSVIDRLEKIRGEFAAGQRTEIPDLDALLAEIA